MDQIEFPVIDFQSELTKSAFDLERIRGEIGVGSTPPEIFHELHGLFQLLTSIASARIEGNHTTILDAITGIQRNKESDKLPSDNLQEILNIQSAMAFIDSQNLDDGITHSFVRELHKRAVEGLVREGDSTPGRYRQVNVAIESADHIPPGHFSVQPDMDLLLEFINRDVRTHEQLVHVALAHHRFLWIHPFKNGNGRVSRLLTYAMLAKHGFVSPIGLRTINPTAVFGNDRNEYYTNLSTADDLSNDGTVQWCTFFMQGLFSDLQRLKSLQDFPFVLDKLVLPALDRFLSSGRVTTVEHAVLTRTVQRVEQKAGDYADLISGSPSQRSVALRGLVERKLLAPQYEGGRYYHLSFGPNEFTPFLVTQLDHVGFLPSILRD
jgi:Fic family protein